MLGQSFHHVNNRRLSVLTSIIKEHKAKQLLKDKSEVFSDSYNDLFSDSLREDWCSSLKVKQKHQEIIKKTSPAREKLPFQGSSPMQNKICNGGRQQEFFVKILSHVLCQGKSADSTLPQKNLNFGSRFRKSTSSDKKSIRFRNPFSSSSKEDKILFKKLGKTNSGPKYLVNDSGLQYLQNYKRVLSSGSFNYYIVLQFYLQICAI